MASAPDSMDDVQQEESETVLLEKQIWGKYMEQFFPVLSQNTYFLPPLFMICDPAHGHIAHQELTPRQQLLREKAAREHEKKLRRLQRKLENAPPKPKRRRRKKKDPQWQPSRIFGDEPEDIQPPPEVPREDQDRRRCLGVINRVYCRSMVVLSQLSFRKWLGGDLNPQHLANPLLPAALHLIPILGPLPVDLQDGEGDFLIFHQQRGLLIGEMICGEVLEASDKGGEMEELLESSCKQSSEALLRRVERALVQIQKQLQAILHLTSDLINPRNTDLITRMLFLPSISRDRLESALSSSEEVKQLMCKVLTDTGDLTEAKRHCICEDGLQLNNYTPDWCDRFRIIKKDVFMTENLYQQLVIRFCGPAATVDIFTTGSSYKEVFKRTAKWQPLDKVEQALDEGWNKPLRYGHQPLEKLLEEPMDEVWEQPLDKVPEQPLLQISNLALTPAQMAILSEEPEPRHVYIQGPPGTGKTMVLLLKALQWVQQKKTVVLISQPDSSTAVTMLLEKQLIHHLGDLAIHVRVHHCSYQTKLKVRSDVARMWRQHGRDCLIIIDQVTLKYGQYLIPWLCEVRKTGPKTKLWMTGDSSRDRTVNQCLQLPHWVEARTLSEYVRFPPKVAELVNKNLVMGVTRYPPIPVIYGHHFLWHKVVRGHTGRDDPVMCYKCANEVADVLKRFKVGQPDGTLQYRDVWILSQRFSGILDPIMVRHLRDYYGYPIVRITGNPLRDGDIQELALGVTDQIVETNVDLVQGLGRKVVICLAPGYQEYSYKSFSRCNCMMICVDFIR